MDELSNQEIKEKMMEPKQSRRLFLSHCAKFCGAGCALMALNRIAPAQETAPAKPGQETKPLDLAALSYCGIACVQVCPLYKATRDNDVAMKKAVYERPAMKKNFGPVFDPDKVFCHTCKPGDKPKKAGMDTCPVRQCALANGVESCVQCAHLDVCDKEYWTKWPGQYASIKMIQARYRSQPGAVMKDGRSR